MIGLSGDHSHLGSSENRENHQGWGENGVPAAYHRPTCASLVCARPALYKPQTGQCAQLGPIGCLLQIYSWGLDLQLRPVQNLQCPMGSLLTQCSGGGVRI